MRVVIALAVLAVFLLLGGCAGKSQVAYVEPLPAPSQSYPSEMNSPPVQDAKQANVGSEPPLSSSPSALSDDEWNTRVLSESIESDTEMKFETVRAKAEKVGVGRLTQADIEGLSFDQIKQLRGY
jgi:hypothetical protein